MTYHNRKDKTLSCLSSFYAAEIPEGYLFNIYLVDDGSTDGTYEAVNEKFPNVKIIKGDGNLFWAGGMRLAWNNALKAKSDYDAFLLLNDDVVLKDNFIKLIIDTNEFSIKTFHKHGIYVCSTEDPITKKITYSGGKIQSRFPRPKTRRIIPCDIPQPCDFANANIFWVSKCVVDTIGILDSKYTHGIADYDYSLRANAAGFPVLITPNIGGNCSDDHGNNWKPASEPLKQRIEYLKSPRGLQYQEYLYYVKRHFPLSLPYSWFMLWLKTIFPNLWEKIK